MKEYVKPDLFYESFELSQHIAACGIDVNYATKEACAGKTKFDEDFWPGMGDTSVFSDDSTCDVSESAIEVYCYTNGTTEAGRLFNS